MLRELNLTILSLKFILTVFDVLAPLEELVYVSEQDLEGSMASMLVLDDG